MALAKGVYSDLAAGYKLAKKFNIDSRQEYDTVADMAAVKDGQMPEMILGFCSEDHNFYIYSKANTKDEVTGKWRKIEFDVKSYLHEQTTAARKWKINHGLGLKYPRVTAFNDDGDEIIGNITYVSDVLTTINFCEALTGTAYVSQ